MQTRIEELILKQLWGELTPDEHLELNEFKNRSEDNRQLVDNLTNPQHLFGALQRSRELDVEASLQKTQEELFPLKKYRVRTFRIVTAAAAGLLIIGGLLVFWFYWHRYAHTRERLTQEKTASPFHQAILTLGNGRVLNLNELKNGSVGEDEPITKKDGQLIYPINYQPKQHRINILETPKGNYYSLRLPDGSTAWLNSGSSIQFPNSFTGNNRTVRVVGEVYFEVTSNPSKPFIVQTIADGSEIQVVGTRFTVNAYKGDNTVRITLLEGKVKVKGKTYTDSLKPREQLIAKEGKKLKKQVVDSAEARVQGWTENKFKWVHTDLRSLLEDLSHWYGVSVSPKIEVPLDTYTITIDRSEPLSNVFKLLEKGTDLNLKLEGGTIVVYKSRGK